MWLSCSARCHAWDLVGSEPSVCLCLVEVGEYANMLLSMLSFWFAGKLFTATLSDPALLLTRLLLLLHLVRGALGVVEVTLVVSTKQIGVLSGQ